MRLGPLARARAAAGAPALKAGLRSAPIRQRLARARRDAMREHGLDEHLAALLGLADVAGKKVYSLTPAQARAAMAEDIAVVDAAPREAVRVRDTSFGGPAGPVSARVYAAEGLPSPAPGLVFYHGGGWVTGDLDTHDSLCRRLAVAARVRVVAIDYRLAPEHRFPAAADDATAAFRWVVASAPALDIDPARVGVAGDSAGGNLSAVVSLRTRGDAVRPAVQALLYAAVDATGSFPSRKSLARGYFLEDRSIDWYLGHYARPEQYRDPDLSPYFAADVAGAPRALVYVADLDPLRDEAIGYAEKLRGAGVDVTLRNFRGMVHGFVLMTSASPAALSATEEIARDIGDALWRASPTPAR
jgi:acetyl esterase